MGWSWHFVTEAWLMGWSFDTDGDTVKFSLKNLDNINFFLTFKNMITTFDPPLNLIFLLAKDGLCAFKDENDIYYR